MFIAIMAAPLQITPSLRLLVDTWVVAAERAEGWRTKDIAYCLGLTVEQWKRQYAAEPGQHVSAYRMAFSPASIMREWIKAIAPAFHLTVIDNADLAAVTTDTRALLDEIRQQRIVFAEMERRLRQ